jgi:shikimate dehydrogenase
MDITGHTRVFAVLGHPVGHSLSPVMHNAAFRALGMDAVYVAFDVEPSELMDVLPAMGHMGFGGVNLTVPLKEVAFRGLRELDESARVAGAVNTIRFTADGLRGLSTDGEGFVRALREAFGLEVRGLDIFVLGCGGAGRTVAIASARQGADRLMLADVASDRCEKVAREIRSLAPAMPVEVAGGGPGIWAEAAHAAALVVQATPLGMKPDDPLPLPPTAFRPGQVAMDLVYSPAETAFMRAASESGARAVNGLGMLLHQGAASFTIWTGQPAPVDVMRRALTAALRGKTGSA